MEYAILQRIPKPLAIEYYLMFLFHHFSKDHRMTQVVLPFHLFNNPLR